MAKKRIMRAFKMNEISAVTIPAQAGALKAIIKRHDAADEIVEADALMKSYVNATAPEADDMAPKSFNDLIAEQDARQKRWEVDEEMWPLFDALRESLRSIACADGVDTAGKISQMQTSIEQFAAAVRERFPEMEAEVEKLLNRDDPFGSLVKAVRCSGGDTVGTKETPMTDNTQKTADLESQVADLTKKLADATAEIEKMKAADIAKNDETVEVGGAQIKKSVVGDEAFKLLKAQAKDIAKAKETAELAGFEKKANEEFGNLPGEAVAKAKVLRAVDKLDAETKAELEKMLKAGDAAMKGNFKPAGVDGGGDFAKADDDLDNLAKAYAAEHKVEYIKAYNAVLDTPRGRELYAKTLTPAAA